MNKLKKILTAMVAVSVLMMAFVPFCFAQEGEEQDSKEQFTNFENYDTRAFDVDITIDENNTYHVKETIDVEFKTASHGIFRYMPIVSTMMRDVDGKKMNFKTRADYSKIDVEGFKYDTENDNGNVVLKIGDADEYVDGAQRYVITYNYRPHDDRMSEYDEVYFNILPNQCPTPIDSAKFTIHMPAAFDESKLKFFYGGYGDNAENMVSYTIDGNTINANINEKIPTASGVTMRLELPQGYFTSQKTDKPLIIILWIIIIAAPIISIILWLIYGRDEKLITPIAVMPPDGMTPADVGYIVDESAETRDIMSLLFYWADKGYITIEDENANEEVPMAGFILTKIKSLPESANEYEHTVFDRLFRGDNNTVYTHELEGKFAQSLETARVQLKAKYTVRNADRLYTSSSKTAEGIATFLGLLPLMAMTFIISYINICGVGTMLIMFGITCFILVFGNMFAANIRSWNGQKKSSRARNAALSLGITTGLSALAVILGCNMLTADNFIGESAYYFQPTLAVIAAVVGTLICVALSSIMRKRTTQMQTWYGEILGLREFIETAEKERLELMVEETPSYFFDIMPYAYVLGVSDKWAKNFENIAVEAPTWYNGSNRDTAFNTYVFMAAMNNNMGSATNQLSTPPPQTGSNGGGFGGSSGGGFSSGGGGGGGGMGSW